MQTRIKRYIKTGEEYDSLFPKAEGGSILKKKGASVSDTIRFIPEVVNETLWQTKKISEVLKGNSKYETCQNVWEFVYGHIAYRKDEDGKEQVRSPARSWSDREQGVDCDCYTVFISSVLSNLGIKHKLRITKYKEDYFQHIYPIVPTKDGKYITIDCVVENFNYEEPYTEKKDTNMDLEYLNGIEDAPTNKTNGADAQDLMGIMDEHEALSELGRLFKKRDKSSGEQKKKKLKEFLKTGLHFTNRLNPTTTILRNGVLASMKLNLMRVAEKLKYAYLSDEEAKKQGVDMARFSRLKRVKDKLESIFYAAGGKSENLKKAILTGRGNRHHEVVAGLDFTDELNGELHEEMNLKTLLGEELFHAENTKDIQGFGALGEPVTAATITAASGIIGAIAGLLKNIGSIFPKKGKDGNKDGDNPDAGSGSDSGSSTDSSSTTSTDDINNSSSLIKTNNTLPTKSDNTASDDNADASNSRSSSNSSSSDTVKETFWNKNKKWVKPAAIGVGTLGVIYLAYHLLKPSKKTKALTGLPKSAKKKGGRIKVKVKSRKSSEKKKAVALL
jgi:hypothetical protein